MGPPLPPRLAEVIGKSSSVSHPGGGCSIPFEKECPSLTGLCRLIIVAIEGSAAVTFVSQRASRLETENRGTPVSVTLGEGTERVLPNVVEREPLAHLTKATAVSEGERRSCL